MNSTIEHAADLRLALVNGAAVRSDIDAISVCAFFQDWSRHTGCKGFKLMGVFGDLIAHKNGIHSAAKPALTARDFH